MQNHLDILALRKGLKWTQPQLAAYLGVDRSTVSRIETGAPVSGPMLRLLRILEKAVEDGTVDALSFADGSAAASNAEAAE